MQKNISAVIISRINDKFYPSFRPCQVMIDNGCIFDGLSRRFGKVWREELLPASSCDLEREQRNCGERDSIRLTTLHRT